MASGAQRQICVEHIDNNSVRIALRYHTLGLLRRSPTGPLKVNDIHSPGVLAAATAAYGAGSVVKHYRKFYLKGEHLCI